MTAWQPCGPEETGGFGNLFLAVAFTMGNKQTVFTHEQLEAYQVGGMCGAALVSRPKDWGQHPLDLGGQSARVPGAALCMVLAEISMVWREGEEAPGMAWAKPTSLSPGLYLLHEEGNHEVSLGRKGGRPGNHFLYGTGGCLEFDKARCFMAVR